MQIVSALKYLNLKKNPVIHYDLKPGLFVIIVLIVSQIDVVSF